MRHHINLLKASLGIVLLCLLQFGDCLKCYNCDSLVNKHCDHLNVDSDEYLVDCSSLDKIGMKRENPVCYQAQGKVNLMIAEGGVVIRGCAEKPATGNACSGFQFPGFHFVSLNCSTCSEDRCNGDYIATASPAIILPTVPPTRTPKTRGGANASSPLYGLLVLSIGYLLVTSV